MNDYGWDISNGYDMGWDNGDTPVLSYGIGLSSDDGVLIGIFPDTESEMFGVEIDDYNGDYANVFFRKVPSAKAIMRDPDLGGFLQKRDIVDLPEIPSDLKERYLATVEDWKNSKVPGVWEADRAYRFKGVKYVEDENTYVAQYEQKDSPSELYLEIDVNEGEGDDIQWSLYFVDKNDGSDITNEVMEMLGLESIRTFADDEKDFLETLELLLPVDEAKRIIRDFLVALR